MLVSLFATGVTASGSKEGARPSVESSIPVNEPEWSYTTRDVIEITDVYELQAMRNNLSANYVLMNDIDASATVDWNGGAGFEPIGSLDNPFTGSFDGCGYKITSLYIDRYSDSNIGLFGYVGSEGVVKNVGLEDANVDGYSFVGGLVGYNYGGTVSNSYSTGSVSGVVSLGGLVGGNAGTVTNCYSSADVNGIGAGATELGGLVGRNRGTISCSYATGTVSAAEEEAGQGMGGLVGYTERGTIIINCYARGDVYGWAGCGGLIGYQNGVATNCYSTGYVALGDELCGGLIGEGGNGGAINCFWDIETSGLTESSGGTGKTTAEMKTESTFTDVEWDFVDIWDMASAINDGYPFFTWAHPDTTLPPAPTLISPPNGAVRDSTPWLDWGDVVDPSGVTYQLQVSRGIAFNHIVYEKSGILPSHHELENALQPGMHFWRVRAIDGAGNAGDWSEVWRFTLDTVPPPRPIPIWPPNNWIFFDSTPLFMWRRVTDPSGVTYQLQVSRDQGFTDVVYDRSSISTICHEVENALSMGRYYWRVRAIDGAGNQSNWSVTRSFWIIVC